MKKHEIKAVRKPDRLSSYWLGQFGICVLIIISGLIYNFGMLASPYFEGRLIDAIEGKEAMSQIGTLLGIFIGTIAIVQVARITKRYTVRRFANNASSSMRLNIYNNLLNLSPKELRKTNIGVLLTRAISDVRNCVEGMRKLTTEIFDTVVVFLFYILYLILFDYRMTLFALIPVAIAIFVAFLMRKAIFKASALSRKANSDMSYATYDLFDNALTYRIYGRDQDNAGVYDRKLSDYEKKTVRSSALTDTMIPIANMIALAGIIPILLLGPTYVTEQAPLFAPIPNLMNPVWTLGQFSTYLTTFVLLASKASHTARLFGSIESGLASWKRIKPYIVPYQEYKTPVEVKGDDSLVFRDFGVEIEDKTLFSGLNLTARKNQIIGITGPIASGKSALGKTFLHDLPYVGSAVLFGKDLDQYAPEEIAGTIVYMGHQSELVTETIEENIALGEKKDVLPYLEAVSFTEDLKNMPEREKTIVGNEGVKLSGGQQERIALARTLYHRKSLVILDDPFASVDPKTEKEILAHLRSELSDSIVLLISHRLTSFSGLDEIIVINGDGTVSVGTEKELLSGNRTYQSLYSLQQNAGEVSHE